MPSRKKNHHHHHRSPPPPPRYNPSIITMPPASPLPEGEEEEQQQLEPINEEPEEEEEEEEEGEEELPEEEEEEEEGEELPEEEDPQQPDLTVPQIKEKKKEKKKKEKKEKKKALTEKAQHNLSLLLLHHKNFHPISKKAHLDLSPQEPLLRALGLWDFATIDLCADDLRTDLLAHLVSSYDPSLQRSFVRNVPLSVSRYTLAKSLGLPLERLTSDPQLFLSDDKSIPAIEEFMANHVLLDEGAASVLPEEATAAIEMVKEGRAGEVDWADLMWVLVEKEILDAPRTGRCPHGPHLQRLMQWQRPGLFGGEAESATVPEPDSDCLMDVSDSVDEDEEEIEECETALSLGLGEKDDAVPLPPEEDRGFEQHCLRRCGSIGNERGMEFENLCKGDEERRGEGFQNLERPTSADLLHGMETVHGSYDHQMNRLEPGNGEFLATGVDADKDKDTATGSDPCGSLFFGNNVERHVHNDDIDGNDRRKRMRTDGLWGEQAPPSNFDSFMEQIQCTMGRAKMLYDEKDQACMNAHMEIRYLTEILEEKDQIIQTLEKTRVEEQQKWQQTVCSYESELNLVAELMLGYKKALKQIDSNFTEYRKKFLHGDEPIYRDVPGEGGLVLSVRELERRQLEKEMEMHQIAEGMVNDFRTSWFAKLEACADGVLVLQKRLMGLDGEIDLLKKRMETSSLN